ncbi:MAG: glutamate--tRNA ligase [Saccharofermentans sp.]|nr:glutamate--tRNA ligase [Saccharofermentans sp.]
MLSMRIRTRFAPSPTGFMHVGNLRTALYEYLTAKHEGGSFVLRIEDTDQERYVEGATQVIYDTLKLAGLTHDEGPDIGGDYGPYVQSERKDIYKPYAEQLVKDGKAYYCFCSKERLDSLRQNAPEGTVVGYDRHCRNLSSEEVEANLKAGLPYVIRQKMPTEGESTYTDLVYGDITIPNDELDDQILIKADGFPTYNFANVIDDHTMGITHVVRGSEYLSSTPKYNALYEAFGWDIPTYIHLPLINGKSVDEEGNVTVSKLSKRHGSTGFFDLVNEGFLPKAIMNYIALLGWCPSGEYENQEIFSMEELIKAFDINGISKSPSVFDYDKLEWMNGEYIKLMDKDEFLSNAKPYYDELNVSPDTYDMLEELLKPRITRFTQIPEKLAFMKSLENYDLDLYEHKKSKSTKETALDALESAIPVLEECDWNRDALGEAIKNLAEKKEVKNSVIMWPVRIAAAGVAVTPGGCSEVLILLGKEESLRRINIGLNRLKGN